MVGSFIRKMEKNKDKNINQGLNAKLKKKNLLHPAKEGEGFNIFPKG